MDNNTNIYKDLYGKSLEEIVEESNKRGKILESNVDEYLAHQDKLIETASSMVFDRPDTPANMVDIINKLEKSVNI